MFSKLFQTRPRRGIIEENVYTGLRYDMDVKQKLSELPAKSGVYLMMDKDGTVIYVGKAKILKIFIRYIMNIKQHI